MCIKFISLKYLTFDILTGVNTKKRVGNHVFPSEFQFVFQKKNNVM